MHEDDREELQFKQNITLSVASINQIQGHAGPNPLSDLHVPFVVLILFRNGHQFFSCVQLFLLHNGSCLTWFSKCNVLTSESRC